MNIEKTISEHAVSDILTPMLESQDRIVTEDVAPLFDQATGLDTPTASGTVTTTIEESRSVITAIIRKAWTATLTMLGGASVISSIAAAYTYLRNRLQGNETYGIPDRRSEISASSPLAANLALLNDRKIGGVPEAADGMSLVHLLLKDYASVTELLDDNTWDVLPRDLKTLTDLFPNVHKLTLGMEEISNRYIASANLYGITEFNVPNLKRAIYCCVDRGFRLPTLTMPELTIYRGGNSSTYGFLGMVNGDTTVTKIECPKMKEFYFGRFAVDCTSLKEVVTDIEKYDETGGYLYMMVNCPNLKRLVFGTVHTWIMQEPNNRSGISDSANLIDMEFGQGTDASINLRSWNPTNALDASRTDLIEEGSTAQNNLQQFLSNFRDYIALRLTDNGSGLTLTLSQAVRNAIHAAEATYGIENIIITQKGWTISPAPN